MDYTNMNTHVQAWLNLIPKRPKHTKLKDAKNTRHQDKNHINTRQDNQRDLKKNPRVTSGFVLFDICIYLSNQTSGKNGRRTNPTNQHRDQRKCHQRTSDRTERSRALATTSHRGPRREERKREEVGRCDVRERKGEDCHPTTQQRQSYEDCQGRRPCALKPLPYIQLKSYQRPTVLSMSRELLKAAACSRRQARRRWKPESTCLRQHPSCK